MYAIKNVLQRLNEDGTEMEDTTTHWILNLSENPSLNPEDNVLKFNTHEEAEKTARDMRLKSYEIVEV